MNIPPSPGDIKIDISGSDNSIILNPQTDDAIKNNLKSLLEKKRFSLEISARCHEYLAAKYSFNDRVLNYTSLTLLGVSFILSTVWGEPKTGTSVNIPWAVTTGITMILKGYQDYSRFAASAKSNETDVVSATDLAEDIEYVLLKNNHTKRTLQSLIDSYDERIKSFRKNESLIPVDVKHKFIPLS